MRSPMPPKLCGGGAERNPGPLTIGGRLVPEEGFEPSVEDPKSPALPLGYSGSPGYQLCAAAPIAVRLERHNTTRTEGVCRTALRAGVTRRQRAALWP